jgi:hypothetical protein
MFMNMSARLKWSGGVASLVLMAAMTAFGQAGARRPVLVELFTSEGCSDCPPADRLLQRLDTEQFVPGADAIVLSEHVTYWNYLGWNDPFSLALADERQNNYGRQFGLSSVYTPQAVVNGVAEMVGSDERGLRQAVAEAAARPMEELHIENARWENGKAKFSLRGRTDASARVYVALAADETHSDVARGENAGRTLHHVAVVQVMKQLGPAILDGHPLELAALGSGLDKGAEATVPVRLVVFVTGPNGGPVLAAAEQKLNR